LVRPVLRRKLTPQSAARIPGDWLGSEGYPRLDPHRGLDIRGPMRADVLAAAGGRVTVARD